MVSPTQNVVRYSALLVGVLYGVVHQRSLQAKYDEDYAKHASARRVQLIEDAKKAWAAKQADSKTTSGLVTDPEDPKFDLEKLVESWAAKA